MSSYNPNSPDALGVEWFPTSASSTALSAATSQASFLIKSSAAETIDSLIVAHTWAGSATGYGKLWAEIYAYSDHGAGATISETTYYPNEDEAAGDWVNEAGSSSNLYQSIDETPVAVPFYFANDYIRTLSSFAATDPAAFHFGSAAFGAHHVLAVYVDVTWGFVTTQGGSPALTLQLWNNASIAASMGYATSEYLYYVPNGVVSTYGPFYVNPVTQEPWTQADIVSFDSSSGLAWALSTSISAGGSNPFVAGMSMRVQHITEKRLAVGGTAAQSSPPSGTQTNLPIQLKTPAGVDNWSKGGVGNTYLCVLRRLDNGQPLSGTAILTPSPKWIDNDDHLTDLDGGEVELTMTAAGQLSSIIADGTTKYYGFALGTSGGAISADSQPYHTVEAFACFSGGEVRQRLTAASTGNFPAARVLVGVQPGISPDAHLTVKVHQASGGAQVGGEITLEWPTDFETLTPSAFSTAFAGDPVRLYELVAEFSTTVPLVSGTTYYVEFTSSSDQETPWMVAALSFEESNALTGTADFGGATLYATADGTDYAASRDLPVLLLSQTTAPTGLAAVVESSAPTSDAGDCDVGSITGALLSWNTTSLGADFGYYEIQRLDRSNDPVSVLVSSETWKTIGRNETESVTSFVDYEPRSNEATDYRIRVVRADGGISSWVTVSVTVTQQDGTLLLTSNGDSSLNAAFVELGPGHQWQFRTSQQRILTDLYDRDYPAEFRPLEKAGTEYPFTVIIYASLSGTPTPGAGSMAFLPLRAIAEAAGLPYVCVRTATGERFFGSLVISQAPTWDAQTNVYLAQCAVTETTATPTVVIGE